MSYQPINATRNHEADENLALWFTPGAVRAHFEGGREITVSDDALAEAAKEVLFSQESLYEEFHNACDRIVEIAAEAERNA